MGLLDHVRNSDRRPFLSHVPLPSKLLYTHGHWRHQCVPIIDVPEQHLADVLR